MRICQGVPIGQTKCSEIMRTDLVLHGVAGVARLEDEDGGVRVLGEARGEGEPCGAAACNDEVVGVVDLAVICDVGVICAPGEGGVRGMSVGEVPALPGEDGTRAECEEEEGREIMRGMGEWKVNGA